LAELLKNKRDEAINSNKTKAGEVNLKEKMNKRSL